MSIFEYNEEEEMRKIRASEYKNGKEDGIAQGIKQGIEQGIEQGMVETCKELGVSFEQTVARLKLLSGKLNDVPSGRLFRADLGSLQIG